MNIFVTGSLGTIGKPLVDALRANGHKIFQVGLFHTSLPENEYCRCDIQSMYQIERAMDIAESSMGKIDVVYHLAAEFGRMNGEDYYDTLWKTNVIGTKHILVQQRKRKFKLIFASSSEIYGELPEGIPYREDTTKIHPIRHYNDYAMTKWVNEQQIVNDMERFGTDSMILRFFNAYGKGEYYTSYRSVVSLFIYRLLHDLPITVYKGYKRVFMHIDDFVPTLARVPEKFKAGEVYNIGGEDYRTVDELVEIIKKYIPETKSDIKYVDKELMNVQSKRPDIAKAVKDLGHAPKIILEDGVPMTVEWMKSI